MKRTLLIGVLLILFLTSANPIGLVRLTVVNKSGLPLGIRLDQINPETDQQALFYYLTVAKGQDNRPAEKSFTIVRQLYTMQVYYIEIHDPVYGYKCASPTSGKLEAVRNTRLVFLKCRYTPPNAGEPGQGKFGGVGRVKKGR